MTFNIKQEKKTVTINVNDIEDKKEKLLERFNKCKDGNCECPTSEYSKLENLEVQSDSDEITLILTIKEDEDLNVDEITACVDYSISNAEE